MFFWIAPRFIATLQSEPRRRNSPGNPSDGEREDWPLRSVVSGKLWQSFLLMPLVPIHLKLNISSLDGQMSTRWPWMEIFPKLYQMFSVARLSALGDSRLALHWYYFIWMRWMQGISSKHLLKTVQSIVALMSRPMPSEIINVLISQI